MSGETGNHINFKKGKKNCFIGLLDILRSQDTFGQAYQMNLDEGKSVNSVMGSICSILILVVTFLYSY